MRNRFNSRSILLWLLLILAGTTYAQIQKLDSVNVGGFYKILYEYDAQSNCTLKTEYRFYANEWHVSFIREYTYDNLNRMTSTVTRGDALNKTEFFYNEQGLLSEEIYSYFNGINWQLTNKYYYEYDGDGNQTLFVEYEYKENVWNEKEKKVFEYEDDRLLTMVRYMVGVLYDKNIYSYNEQGLREEMSLYLYRYEPWPGGWVEYYKELYEYDEAGNLLSKTTLQKNMNSDDLTYRNKTEFIYDQNSNCIHIDEYGGYDYDLEQWLVLGSSYDFSYDHSISINDIVGFSLIWEEISTANLLYVPIFNKIQRVTKTDGGDAIQYDFYYSSFNGLCEPIENNPIIWPNPTKETVCIEGVDVVEVKVYNAFGQFVKETKDNVIDLSDQNAGTYIIKVITPSGIHTKQIIKN